MTAVKASGTSFSVLDSDGTTWLSMCPLTIDGRGQGQATVLDRTTLCSTAKEKGMGLKDEGQATVSVLYDPSDSAHKRMQYLRDNQEAGSFKVVLTDSGAEEWTFDAYVLTCGLDSLTADTDVKMTFNLEITGPISIA